MKNKKIYQMTLSALLCAIGIIIPIISPFRIIIEPASFTLASHVALMIAMFISPLVGIVVSVGTTLGFLFAGFPITVVARAASQIVFVAIGGYILVKKPNTLKNAGHFIPFFLGLSLIHAMCEVLIVIPFYGFTSDFLYSVFFLVGIGTFIHSMVDFMISLYIYKILPIKKERS